MQDEEVDGQRETQRLRRGLHNALDIGNAMMEADDVQMLEWFLDVEASTGGL